MTHLHLCASVVRQQATNANRRVVAETSMARWTLAAFLLSAFMWACGRASTDDVTLEVLDTGLFDDGPSADPSLAIDPVTGELLIAWVAQSPSGEQGTHQDSGHEAGGVATDDAHAPHASSHASMDGAWNLWLTRSADGGDSFATPSRVNDIAGDVLPHAEGAPRLVAAPGVVALFWNNQLEAEGREWGGSDIRFARSIDGAVTWSRARSLQDPLEIPGLPPRTHTFHGGGWAGDSTLAVAWIDYREQDRRRIERGVAAGLALEDAIQRRNDFADTENPHETDGVGLRRHLARSGCDLGVSQYPDTGSDLQLLSH